MPIERVLILIVLIPVVYLALYQIVQWIIRRGLLDWIYRQFFFPRRTLHAHLRGDAQLADQQIYRSYLSLLVSGNDGQRDLALQYLAQLPATPNLAHALIINLPRERRPESRARLSRLLRFTLNELERQTTASDWSAPNRRAAWARAFSTWLTELVLILVHWSWLAQMSIGEFLIAALLGLIVALLPMFALLRNGRAVLRLAVAIILVSIAGMWWFSETAHTGQGSTPVRPLSTYGIDGVSVQITYPQWLTGEDINDCTDKIVVYVYGNRATLTQTADIVIPLDRARLASTDTSCQAQDSVIPISHASPAGEPFRLHVQVLNREALAKGPMSVVPVVLNPTIGQALPAADLAFTIQFEDATWQTIRDVAKLAGSTSATALIVLAVTWYRKQK